MKSEIDKDLVVIDGKLHLIQKEYPNWYGIEDIGFIWHGEWADPYIEYKGHQLNSVIIEDSMWDDFMYDHPNGTEDEFEKYMMENVHMVYEYIELALESEVLV